MCFPDGTTHLKKRSPQFVEKYFPEVLEVQLPARAPPRLLRLLLWNTGLSPSHSPVLVRLQTSRLNLDTLKLWRVGFSRLFHQLRVTYTRLCSVGVSSVFRYRTDSFGVWVNPHRKQHTSGNHLVGKGLLHVVAGYGQWKRIWAPYWAAYANQCSAGLLDPAQMRVSTI